MKLHLAEDPGDFPERIQNSMATGLKMVSRLQVLVLEFPSEPLRQSAELELGRRELVARLSGFGNWRLVEDASHRDSVLSTIDGIQQELLLIILNPAIIVSDNLLDEMLSLIEKGIACVLPEDQRGGSIRSEIDYATRPGFDRFVSRLQNIARTSPYDEREPWVYLVLKSAVMALAASCGSVDWQEIPRLLNAQTVIANRAYLHSYADYFQNSRSEMVPMIPATVHSLLDVGGGAGGFAAQFRESGRGTASVLERHRPAVLLCADDVEVIEGELENLSAERKFDCIALLDVLEHLADPFESLQRCASHLNDPGYLLLSVPNVGYWQVLRDLIEGDFNYQPVGILCNTHLRFFTGKSLRRLLDSAGYEVVEWKNIKTSLPAYSEPFAAMAQSKGVAVDRENLATESFHVLARMVPGRQRGLDLAQTGQ